MAIVDGFMIEAGIEPLDSTQRTKPLNSHARSRPQPQPRPQLRPQPRPQLRPQPHPYDHEEQYEHHYGHNHGHAVYGGTLQVIPQVAAGRGTIRTSRNEPLVESESESESDEELDDGVPPHLRVSKSFRKHSTKTWGWIVANDIPYCKVSTDAIRRDRTVSYTAKLLYLTLIFDLII